MFRSTAGSLRMLAFAYISALILILLFLISGQGVIQWLLGTAQHNRSVVAAINAQELSTERMFYNVLLLQNPEGNGVDYLAINKLILADEPAWEQTQDAIYGQQNGVDLSPADFGALAQKEVTQGKPFFLKMQTAYRTIFALEQKDAPASPDLVRPYVDTIYLAESPYLNSLIAIYSALEGQSDNRVSFVRTTELILFSLTILILFVEAFFIVRPALLNQAHLIQRLDSILKQQAVDSQHQKPSQISANAPDLL